jgi:hypothetical protein
MIPNHFIFIYGLKKQKEPFHLVHYLALESCRRINRPDAIFFFHHYEPYGPYWERIRPHLKPVRVEPIPRIAHFRYGFRNRGCTRYRYAHHSDFIRLDKLLELGGIYADMDTLFVNPFPSRLYEKSFVLGRENEICTADGQRHPSLCNALILSEPRASFARLWRDEMDQVFNGSWSNHSTLLPQKLSVENPELIHIEPPRSFYKHMWTQEGIRNLLEGCDPDFSDVYSMHLWAHLWWSKRRRDYSDFHAGLLTESFIREKDTTYNIAARPFLP